MEREPFKDQGEFKKFSEDFQASHKMPAGFAIGFGYKDNAENPDERQTIANKWLAMSIKNNMGAASAIMEALSINGIDGTCYREFGMDELQKILSYFDVFKGDKTKHANIEALRIMDAHLRKGDYADYTCCSVIFYENEEILLKNAVSSIADAHFRLAAISRRHYLPNVQNLDNLMNILPMCVWTRNRVYRSIEWNEGGLWATATEEVLTLDDKIPQLNWGAPVPSGVRMPNPRSARLGAYLGEGTTIMPYGHVNFNAGTKGKSMVEGRIPQGVIVEDETDIGADASILGTMSGGNNLKISIGKDCLLGVGSETGICLGNNCVVAMGVHFDENTPFWEVIKTGKMIKVFPSRNPTWEVTKAGKLVKVSHHRGPIKKVEEEVAIRRKAGYFNYTPNLTFRRNADNGRMEVLHKGNKAVLDPTLHVNK